MGKLFPSLAIVASAFLSLAVPAQAQMAPIQQIGMTPWGAPLCTGPLGPGLCSDIVAWMQRGGMNQAQPSSPGGGFAGSLGPAGLPTGFVPQDGQILMQIQQSCGGEPRCMAAAWASVEVQRCRGGFGVPGGCFGPNGEIIKVINQFVPQHLQPNVIINNVANDIQHGPDDHNDVTGKDGWLRKRLGF